MGAMQKLLWLFEAQCSSHAILPIVPLRLLMCVRWLSMIYVYAGGQGGMDSGRSARGGVGSAGAEARVWRQGGGLAGSR